MFIFFAVSTGRPKHEIDQTWTMADIDGHQDYFKKFPPLHITARLIAGALGIKFQDVTPKDIEQDFSQMFPGGTIG